MLVLWTSCACVLNAELTKRLLDLEENTSQNAWRQFSQQGPTIFFNRTQSMKWIRLLCTSQATTLQPRVSSRQSCISTGFLCISSCFRVFLLDFLVFVFLLVFMYFYWIILYCISNGFLYFYWIFLYFYWFSGVAKVVFFSCALRKLVWSFKFLYHTLSLWRSN